MSKEFAIADIMSGKLNALVKNIMRQTGETDPNEAVRLVNSGEWIISKPTRLWREEDDIIYFSVESDGTTGEGWINRLADNFRVGEDYAKEVLRSPSFVPTSGVTTEVAVLRGCLFEDYERTTEKIRAEADKCKLFKPNAEVACLIREKFTNQEIEEMGLWYIVAMHEPIIDGFDGEPCLLGASCRGNGRWLDSYGGWPGHKWRRDHGFAFVVSQVSSQS